MSCSRNAAIAAAFLTVSGVIASARAQSSAFTYQGRLSDNGSPAQGAYDVQFNLFDAPVGGAQVGSTDCFDGVQVAGGLFTVQVDFGVTVFDGGDRWLEISVRADSTPGNCASGVYTILTPRQPLTATPYALQTRGLFTDSSKNVGIGTTSPQAKLNVAGGDLRIDDGLFEVNTSGTPIYQMLSTSPGAADLFFNKNTGTFVTALGTSNDGSGFLDLYDQQTQTLMAELDADIDQNANNGIAAGGLFVRSQGTGGGGGQISVQNNDGHETIKALGGGSTAPGTLSMFNAASQTTVRLTGDINGLGGELRTSDEAGSAQCIVQPDFDGGGVFVSWARDTGSNGLVFDGNSSGSGNPTLNLSSSVSPMAFNTNATGNASVVLPNNAISSTEILDEPGVANNHANSTGLTSSVAPLISRSITVPATGFVLVLAQGDLQIAHVTGTATNCNYGVSAASNSLPTDQDVQTQLASPIPSGTYDFSASAHGLFAVDSAGTFTYYFNANRSTGGAGGSATMFDLQLTLVYSPTAYGPTVPNLPDGNSLTDGGLAEDNAGEVSPPLTDAEIAAEQAEAAAFHQARLEQELAQMQAQMAEMQAHLEQIEREQGLARPSAPPQAAPAREPNVGP